MDLTVVIPTHNKAALLGRTLQALALQDAGSGRSWEAVVVDDGSSDGTAAAVRALAAAFPAPLRLVQPGRNVGRAAARNRGLKDARGEFILFLDDDIVCPEGLLRAHLDLLLAGPDRGTIGFAVTDPDLVDAAHFHYLDTRGAARLGPGPAPARFFVTQNAAAPRQALLEVGGFDEEFSTYGFEDMELAFRLEDQAGVRFLALPAPVPRHIHHHTLEDYLQKKVLCGRHSLPLLAELHPRRIAEMNLSIAVDPADGRAGPASRAVRTLLAVLGPRPFMGLVRAWPTGPGHWPRFFPAYVRLMNLTVLTCFIRGIREDREDRDGRSAGD